ncbi:MAG TPA: histidinol-phosphatase [Thermoanaerobaculia bacterium]|nr:histidinol-phosphatase [Thermoanaerobaculia bacterium]
MNGDLQLALELADAADAITLKHFQSATLAVRTKLDMSPVSEADEAVERMIRERLETERPDDSILGEEFGTTGTGPRRWIIDPIDGTKNYVRGIPVYATLIGVEENGRLSAGVVSAPALGRRWWASRGEGAFCNGKRIRVSQFARLEESHLTYDSVTDFDQHGGTVRFLSLLRRCVRARGFGDFWAHMLVAEGAVEIALEPAVAPWDMAAVQIIVEEAGGRFTDMRGNPRYDGGSALSTNGLVHDAVLEFFR